MEDFRFCKFYKGFLVFCVNVAIEVILNLNLGKDFLWRYTLSHQVRPSRHYTEQIPFFGERIYHKLDHERYHHNQKESNNRFLTAISADLGGMFCNQWKSPKVLFIFKDTISRSLSIIKLVSSITPNCFSDDN